MQSPMDAFNELWKQSLQHSPLKQKNAICVSTIDKDGFPNSRFVDLKEADEQGLVFCTSLESTKAQDIARDPRAGMTIWWDHIGIQVRFQGFCTLISDEETDAHWRTRSKDAQLTTISFQQSKPLDDLALLSRRFLAAKMEYAGKEITRPGSWGGFRLAPTSVEILEFKEDRLHARTLYVRRDGIWNVSYLQP